jgi:hypothetical protein
MCFIQRGLPHKCSLKIPAHGVALARKDGQGGSFFRRSAGACQYKEPLAPVSTRSHARASGVLAPDFPWSRKKFDPSTPPDFP